MVWDAFALNRPLNLRSRIGSVVGRFKVAVLKGQQIKLINFVSYRGATGAAHTPKPN